MARVVTQAAFTISGTVAQGLVRLAIPILVGRFADKSDLTQTSFVLSICVLLSMLWPTPAGTAASRYVVDASSGSARALSTLTRSTVISLTLIAALSFVIVFVSTGNPIIAVVGLATTTSYSAYYFTRGVFLGRFRASALARWETIGAAVAIAGAFGALALGLWQGTLVALAVGYAVIAVAGWPRRTREHHAADRRVLSFTLHNAIANASSNGMIQLAMVVVFALTAPTSSADFAAAFALATPASMFGQALNQTLVPHLAEQAASEKPSGRALMTGGAKLVALTALAFAAVFALSPIVLPLIYGHTYVSAVPIMQALVVAMFFFTVSLLPSAALTAWGNARELVAVNITALIIGTGAMLALTSALGPLGTAAGLVTGTVVLFILTTAVMARELRRDRTWPIVSHD